MATWSSQVACVATRFPRTLSARCAMAGRRVLRTLSSGLHFVSYCSSDLSES